MCCTVGMMTNRYDCPDFIQIKGRGTRKHTFTVKTHNNVETHGRASLQMEKQRFIGTGICEICGTQQA